MNFISKLSSLFVFSGSPSLSFGFVERAKTTKKVASPALTLLITICVATSFRISAAFTLSQTFSPSNSRVLRFSGDATYYDPSVGVGACGSIYKRSDLVCAINTFQYGNFPNPNNANVCEWSQLVVNDLAPV
ncbi:hypothetical protein AYI68_g7978 [Smittium mucronatum]|uniref:Uncharacterized protein n=1 Tax=Smittium mucronatum TaxID=133383 RepID=A0A1R0GM52_9FUNG|nr:hypothetical protein AYI68_g7978 [Smittium mucronatum]